MTAPKPLNAWLIPLTAAFSLAACTGGSEVEPEAPEDPATEEAEPEQDPPETVSILRPEIEATELPPEPLETLEVTIGFPGGGAELDEAAIAALEDVLTSEQMEAGGSILLGAHSDSAGSDRVNERAAEARGLAVAAWLVEQGVASSRIDVIVFGEQNPLQPNALPDGSPNEEGRAANRRVEVAVLMGFLSRPVADDSIDPSD